MLRLIVKDGAEELVINDVPADFFEKKLIVVSKDDEGVQLTESIRFNGFDEWIDRYNDLVSKYNASCAVNEGLRNQLCRQIAVNKGLIRRTGSVNDFEHETAVARYKELQERFNKMTDNYQKTIERCEELLLEVDRLKKGQ